jgi:hypothetical protein
MERTDKQKEQLLKDLWHKRNPCHDNDQEGNDRFWGTVLCVFDDYNLALNTPFVIGQGEQLMQSCSVCGNHKHPLLGAHCKASNCPNEH